MARLSQNLLGIPQAQAPLYSAPQNWHAELMSISLLSAFALYFLILISIGLWASPRHETEEEYILGGRSLNYWVTAISANASDMSVWIFMGLPLVIYTKGLMSAWTVVGLVVFMFLNWHIVAPKLRRETEKYSALTLFTFFEKKSCATNPVRFASSVPYCRSCF